MSDPLFITMHTDERYERLAARLCKSAEKFSIEVKAIKRPHLARWADNLFQKAEVIRENMDVDGKRDLVWLDADAWLERKPDLFWKIDADFAAYFGGRQALYGGVKWFKAGQIGVDIVDRWIKQNQETPQYIDDNNLLHVLGNARVFHLPPAYSWTEKWMRRRFPGADPVICHDMVVTANDPARRKRETMTR